MKKLISLVAVFAIIATSSLCAFAADIDFASAADITAQAVDGVYTVAAPSTAAYATIVAVKGTEIKVGAIQYINQAAAEGGSASFSFALNDELVKASTVEDTKVYVLTGGDGNINVAGYIETATQTPEEPPVQNFTIAGTVSGFSGATLPVVKVTDGTNEYVADVDLENKTFSVEVPELTEGSYTLTATKAAHLKYTKASIASTTEGLNVVVKPGDLNDDNYADIGDIGVVITYFGATSTDGSGRYSTTYDPNEDTAIDIGDIGVVITYFGAASITE